MITRINASANGRAQNSTGSEDEGLENDFLGLSEPLFITLCLLLCATLITLAVLVWWKIAQSKRSHCSARNPLLKSATRNHSQIKPPLGLLNISQSTPDLTRQNSMERATLHEKKSPVTQFLRQTTMPNVPQRHQSFQRRLSQQLDMSQVEFKVSSVKKREQPSLGRLKPELYKYAVCQPEDKNAGVCGKFYFGVTYDHSVEVLNVHIIKAEHLPAKDFSGTSDPYVKIYLLPERKKKFQTKVHRKTLNPVFEELFAFNVPYAELDDRALHFSLYDFDRFSRHDLIGNVSILFKEIFTITDLSIEKEISRDILCTQKEKVDLGELMLSLCYLPTAGRLTVTLVKARNLKAMDVMGASDPYVKVALMCREKRIKKKKTCVKKNTLHPVYNEALVFDVPSENVEEVSLLIKVIDYDRVGSNELIGCCAAGLQYPGQGREHWHEMLNNSRKPIAQWYSLVEHVHGAAMGSNRSLERVDKPGSRPRNPTKSPSKVS